MTLEKLCEIKKDNIFTYKIDNNFKLWFQAQTVKENLFGEEISCDIETENDKVTHFIVELWIKGENEDMLVNLSNCEINKDFDIQYYLDKAYNYLRELYTKVTQLNNVNEFSNEELSNYVFDMLEE